MRVGVYFLNTVYVWMKVNDEYGAETNTSLFVVKVEGDVK